MGTGLVSQSVDIVVLAFRGPWDVMEKALARSENPKMRAVLQSECLQPVEVN